MKLLSSQENLYFGHYKIIFVLRHFLRCQYIVRFIIACSQHTASITLTKFLNAEFHPRTHLITRAGLNPSLGTIQSVRLLKG